MSKKLTTLSLPLFSKAIAVLLLPLHLVSLWPVQMLAFEENTASVAEPAFSTVPLLVAKLDTPEFLGPLPAPSYPQTAIPQKFSATPTLEELAQSSILAEPLLPIGTSEVSQEEMNALAQACLMFSANSSDPEDVSALETFLGAHPQSAFRVSLLTNLGLIYRHHGYWSKALNAWQQAWQAGKAENDPTKRLVVDQALAHLAELTARIGRVDDLKALFNDVGSRAMRGPAAEKYTQAKASLFLMESEPHKSFRCGPLAVGQVILALHPESAPPKEVHDSVSTGHGTSMATIDSFARSLGLDYQVAYRSIGAPILVPSVVNWKVGHYAALTQTINGRFMIKDPTFTDDFVVSQEAIDQEASGYFLVRSGSLPEGWRVVSGTEATQVWGKGATVPQTSTTPPGTGPCSCGMPVATVDFSQVNLYLNDTPFFYSLPRGPAVEFKTTYSQRDSAPISVTKFPNLGVQWNCNWVAFIVDDPNNISTSSYGPGGGKLKYTGYNSTTQSFAPQTELQTVLSHVPSDPNTSYTRTFPDGSRQVFGFSRTISNTKYVFMTESDDPVGNRTLFNYNATTGRLDSVTDAMGGQISISYATGTVGSTNYFSISQVTEMVSGQPRRSAIFSYNMLGQLSGITDMAGMTSTFTYDSSDHINRLTTPYGPTTFAENDFNSDRSLVITDPQGGSEKIVFKYSMVPPDQGSPQPSASGLNIAPWEYAQYRTTYHWDKQAYAVAPNDYSKAHLYHFLHLTDGGGMSDILESEKPALETRIYYNYANQPNYFYSGPNNLPTIIARIVGDGTAQTTQVTRCDYNAQGNLIRFTSPANRITTYHYDTNHVDLLAVYQQNSTGTSTDDFGAKADLIHSMTYDALGQHLRLTDTDAAGLTTTFIYNSFGQPLSVKNAKNEKTTFMYSHDAGYAASDGTEVTDGYLLVTTAPSTNATTTFGYDSINRVAQITDSAGYAVGITYDAIGGDATKTLNRVAKRTYPDGTFEAIEYYRLDPQWSSDRLGRWTQYLYDGNRHLAAIIDPLNRVTSYDWCSCGSLEGITDPAGNHTTWMRDAESRVTAKIYQDGTSLSTIYEQSTSRIKSTTDAKNQRTNFKYNVDDSLAEISYTDVGGAALVPPTPTVGYAYDTAYPRLVGTTVVGLGTTSYSYNSVPSAWPDNAGRLHSEGGLFANDTITYSYDQLGRKIGDAINGSANASTYSYDALGRVQTVNNALGANGFSYGYVGNTARLNNVAYPNGQTTTYSYFGGTSDPRLQTIRNLTSTGSEISRFDYTYSAVGDILSWTQGNSGSPYPQRYGLGYDADSELTSATLTSLDGSQFGTTISTQAYSYDAAGNRSSVQTGGNVYTETPNNLNQLKSTGSGGLMRFGGTVGVSATPSGNKLATVTVGNKPATVRADGSYEGWAQVNSAGTTSVSIVATDTADNTTTNHAIVTPGTVTAQSFGYDQNGNQTTVRPSDSPPTITYGWDAANRLVSITSSSSSTSFTYDGLSRRVAESTTASNGTVGKRWVWIGMSLAEERDGSNNVTKQFYEQGERIAGQSYFYTRDHLGSVRELVDGTNQSVRGRYGYDLYGMRSANLVTSSPAEADFGFAGYYFHRSSGLHLALYRAYDAVQGRWISRDPIGENGGINLYDYVGNNSVVEIDPLGLAWENLPEGYSARTDTFNTGSSTSYEIHVNDAGGNEVGVFGRNGWIPKHGFDKPPTLPSTVANAVNGMNIAAARSHGTCPPKGRANITGWMGRLGRISGRIGMIGAFLSIASSANAQELQENVLGVALGGMERTDDPERIARIARVLNISSQGSTGIRSYGATE